MSRAGLPIPIEIVSSFFVLYLYCIFFPFFFSGKYTKNASMAQIAMGLKGLSCPHMNCTSGGLPQTLLQIAEHMEKCIYKLQKCWGCKKSISIGKWMAHINKCDSIKKIMSPTYKMVSYMQLLAGSSSKTVLLCLSNMSTNDSLSLPCKITEEYR